MLTLKATAKSAAQWVHQLLERLSQLEGQREERAPCFSYLETLIKLLRNNNQIAAVQVNGTSESLSRELYLMCNRPGVVQVPFQALI